MDMKLAGARWLRCCKEGGSHPATGVAQSAVLRRGIHGQWHAGSTGPPGGPASGARTCHYIVPTRSCTGFRIVGERTAPLHGPTLRVAADEETIGATDVVLKQISPADANKMNGESDFPHRAGRPSSA